MAPPEWITRFKGQFNEGWDKMREEIFARAKRMGVIPADAELTPRLPEIPAWDSLSPAEKQYAISSDGGLCGFVAERLKSEAGGSKSGLQCCTGALILPAYALFGL